MVIETGTIFLILCYLTVHTMLTLTQHVPIWCKAFTKNANCSM